MPVILFNNDWMLYNCYLALLAVGFGYLFLWVKSRIAKGIFGLLWLLFLPNTIYLFTDLEHLIYQWNTVVPSIHLLLFTQYLMLEFVGIITFLFAFLPFEIIINWVTVFKKRKVAWLILVNFCVAFGMVLGRVERLNSWDVFINPLGVLQSAINVFMSFDLLGLTMLFALLCNFVYFLFRDLLLRKTRKYFHISD